MAAFLNRGLPRAAIAQLSATATSANEVPAGTLTVRASGPTGGTALVLLNATVWTYTSNAGCPCQLGFTLVHGPSTVSTYVDLQNPSGGDSYSDVHRSDQLLVAIPTGVNQTFSVTVSRRIGTAPLIVSGELTALVVPYDGLGNNPVVGAALESATERTNGE
jgi:hypothetical protein